MSLPVRYEIEHISRYLYEWPVRSCVMAVCLHPQNDERQQLLRFDLSIDPPAPHNAEQDAFGNTKHVFNILREHDRLEMTAQSIVVTLPPETPPESMDSGGLGGDPSGSGVIRQLGLHPPDGTDAAIDGVARICGARGAFVASQAIR